MSTTKKATAANGEKYDGFTDDERAAMKERATGRASAHWSSGR